MWEVEYYHLPGGRCPLEKFLSKLNIKTDLPFIDRIFDKAEEFGHRLPMPHSRPLRDKIFELRVKTPNGTYRFPYFFDNKKIMITHGFKKKTDKTPKYEIEKAINYRNTYFESSKK